MPRKPKPPPITLRIERLSDGVDPTARDDFDGSVLPQPNAKRPPNLHRQRQLERQVAREHSLKVLNALGITHEGYKQPERKPALKHNQRMLGDKVVTVPRNPNAIKRRF